METDEIEVPEFNPNSEFGTLTQAQKDAVLRVVDLARLRPGRHEEAYTAADYEIYAYMSVNGKLCWGINGGEKGRGEKEHGFCIARAAFSRNEGAGCLTHTIGYRGANNGAPYGPS